MKKNTKAFSLIEVMVAIAIVGILAAVVLVAMSSYGKRARASNALASLSSAIPGMVSCWGNGGTVNSPSSGGSICSLASSYGQWPQTAGSLSSYAYTGSTITDRTTWFVMLTSSTDDRRVCCNSAMMNCKLLDTASSTCNATSPAY